MPKRKQTPDARLELSNLGLKGPRANQFFLLSVLKIEIQDESYQLGMDSQKIAYFHTYVPNAETL